MKVGEGWLAPEFDENLVGAVTGQKVSFGVRALTEASADEGDAEELSVTASIVAAERPERIDITDEWVAANITGASSSGSACARRSSAWKRPQGT